MQGMHGHDSALAVVHLHHPLARRRQGGKLSLNGTSGEAFVDGKSAAPAIGEHLALGHRLQQDGVDLRVGRTVPRIG
jgi:hypothetical protein